MQRKPSQRERKGVYDIRPDLLKIDTVAEHEVDERVEDPGAKGKDAAADESIETRRKAIARVVVPIAVPREDLVRRDQNKQNHDVWPESAPEHSHNLPKGTRNRLTGKTAYLQQKLFGRHSKNSRGTHVQKSTENRLRQQ
jgi:hypothetical protein